MEQWKCAVEKIKSFYKNKKVLVTGATGFKGAWLTSWLLYLGAKVIGACCGSTPDTILNIVKTLESN